MATFRRSFRRSMSRSGYPATRRTLPRLAVLEAPSTPQRCPEPSTENLGSLVRISSDNRRPCKSEYPVGDQCQAHHLEKRREPVCVDVLTEEPKADRHSHDGLSHGEGGQGKAQGSGVKRALSEKQGADRPGHHGIRHPRSEGGYDPRIEEVAGTFGECCHVTERHPRAGSQQHSGPAWRPTLCSRR